jgi:hypothetical protein
MSISHLIHFGLANLLLLFPILSDQELKQVDPSLGENPSFAPSKISMNLKNQSVSFILDEINRQTGNKVALGNKINNIDLPAFQTEEETFWQVIDKLGKTSQNVYHWGPKSG